MINGMQAAIIKKDIRNITANKRMLSVLIIVPLVMTIVLPSSFILPVLFSSGETSDITQLASLLGDGALSGDLRRDVLDLLLNSVMPMFFLMIPVMCSSVMAANAFVGEKEKNTLETLLYCPLRLKEIFSAKIIASFLLSMAVSILSFIVMISVVEVETLLAGAAMIMPDISWLIMMLIVSPSVSLIAINFIVRGSAKAQTMEESQQRSAFLIFPIIMLAMGQFTGIMMLGPLLFLGLGLVFAAIAILMLRSSFGKFKYETLLR